MIGAKRAAEPIIAALSVQSAGGTSLSRTPRASHDAVERGTQRAVGGDAAAEGQRPPLTPIERPLGLRDELADDRGLEARGEIGPSPFQLVVGEVAHRVDQ